MTPTPRSFATIALGLALGLACAPKPATTEEPDGAGAGASADAGIDEATRAAIEAALAGAHRSDKNRARDGARHPLETLAFFGLRRDMTVVELWPGGGGWYTEILAPVLREGGKLIATNFDASKVTDPNDYRARVSKSFADKIAGDPALYDRVTVVTVDPPNPFVLAPAGSVDMVLTFRNSHGWIEDGMAPMVYKAAFDALRPGGVLGVVQHRAKADDARDPKALAETGYVREDYLVQTIEAVGFKLDAKSEVNANPKDTKDYEKGVWTLPPALTLGEVDKAKYEEIGESDRMTLRFVKP
ncbi:MAG TPA: methyltransferase [Nannocystaceae bacterium]|nr:methyltransferase [Nannocystaceae bacterium]